MGESDWRRPPRQWPQLFELAVEPADRDEAERLVVDIDADLSKRTREKLEEVLRKDDYERATRALHAPRGRFARAVTKADESLLTIIKTLRRPGSEDVALEYSEITVLLADAHANIQQIAQAIANTPRVNAAPTMPHYLKYVGDVCSLGYWNADQARTLLRACGFRMRGRRQLSA